MAWRRKQTCMIQLCRWHVLPLCFLIFLSLNYYFETKNCIPHVFLLETLLKFFNKMLRFNIILVKGPTNISFFPCRTNYWTYDLFSFSQKPIKKSCTVIFPFRLQRCQFYSEMCFISSLNESVLLKTDYPLSINAFDYVFHSIYLKYRKLGSRKLGETNIDVFKKGKGLTLTKLTPPLQIFLIT